LLPDHQPIGIEIPVRMIKYQLYWMIDAAEVLAEGEKRWRRHSINKKKLNK